jgi:regulator of replication initiation timing
MLCLKIAENGYFDCMFEGNYNQVIMKKNMIITYINFQENYVTWLNFRRMIREENSHLRKTLQERDTETTELHNLKKMVRQQKKELQETQVKLSHICNRCTWMCIVDMWIKTFAKKNESHLQTHTTY